MAKLQILTGKKRGSTFDLPATADTDIGNRKSAALSIRDPWISYNHAKISSQNGRFVIEDLGSSNGTWIDGKKIKRAELSASVLIYFGKTKCRFTADKAAGAAPSAAPTATPAGSAETPWWDQVLDTGQDTSSTGGDAKTRRLESELRDERRMRQTLETFLSKGSTSGDAAQASELEREVKALRAKVAAGGGGGTAPASDAQITEAVEAERGRSEKLRREHMSTLVELEGKVSQAESKAVELESRLKDKTEQAKKDVLKAKEKSQDEIEELKGALEEARQSATDLAGGGDGALSTERERGDKLQKEADELKTKLREAEERKDALESELEDAKANQSASGDSGNAETLETIKSQLWASIEEATKWKEEAAQLTEDVEAARSESDSWKDEHAQIVQEIDEISMEQIDVEDELNNRIRELEDKLGIPHSNPIDDGDAADDADDADDADADNEGDGEG
jgi:myosin heavy subunit